MPLGHTATTLMSGRKASPCDLRWPRRKPWDSPSTAPGFMAPRMVSWLSACTPTHHHLAPRLPHDRHNCEGHRCIFSVRVSASAYTRPSALQQRHDNSLGVAMGS